MSEEKALCTDFEVLPISQTAPEEPRPLSVATEKKRLSPKERQTAEQSLQFLAELQFKYDLTLHELLDQLAIDSKKPLIEARKAELEKKAVNT